MKLYYVTSEWDIGMNLEGHSGIFKSFEEAEEFIRGYCVRWSKEELDLDDELIFIKEITV